MTADATHPATPDPAGKAARAAFIAFAILAVMVWIGIAVGANVRTPGVIGLAAAVFGGLSAAVLTLAIGGWIALKLAEAPARADTPAATPHADPAISPALAAVETAQRPILRRMVERSAWRTPLFAAVAIAAWCVLVLLGASGGVFDFSIILLGGGLAGYGWSHREASKELAGLYLQRGAGTLAATHDLAWCKPTRIDIARLRTENVLPPSSEAISPGEIAGTHRGIAMRIAPIKTRPMPDRASAADGVFTGLLIELESPHLTYASLEAAVAADPRLAVRIGQFHAISGLGAPVSSVTAGRLSIAVPETARPRVFDPPSSSDSKTAAKRLARIAQVLSAATGVADVLSAQPGDTLPA